MKAMIDSKQFRMLIYNFGNFGNDGGSDSLLKVFLQEMKNCEKTSIGERCRYTIVHDHT